MNIFEDYNSVFVDDFDIPFEPNVDSCVKTIKNKNTEIKNEISNNNTKTRNKKGQGKQDKHKLNEWFEYNSKLVVKDYHGRTIDIFSTQNFLNKRIEDIQLIIFGDYYFDGLYVLSEEQLFVYICLLYQQKRCDEQILANVIKNLCEDSGLYENINYKGVMRQIFCKQYKQYKHFTNDYLIKIFDISLDAQRHLKVLISRDEKLRRHREHVKRTSYYKQAKKDRRNENGLTSREQSKLDNINKIRGLLKKGYKQKDICAKLELSKSTVSEYVKTIKNENSIV